MNYSDLVKEFRSRPRDIKTNPINDRSPLWFYVYVEGDIVYVASAKDQNHQKMSCSIKKSRRMNSTEFEDVLDVFNDRKNKKPVSQKAAGITMNAVYWYGIFAEMGW